MEPLRRCEKEVSIQASLNLFNAHGKVAVWRADCHEPAPTEGWTTETVSRSGVRKLECAYLPRNNHRNEEGTYLLRRSEEINVGARIGVRERRACGVVRQGGVAFDGTNIWVSHSSSDNVTKLQPSDGTVLGTFAAGPSPKGMGFDGANMWIANGSGSTVTKLRASGGTILGTFPVGFSPYAVVFDGANIW